MSARDDRIDKLFAARSFVLEAALVCIAARIEQVKDVSDLKIFLELATTRASAEIGALIDGTKIAQFITKRIVTLRKLAMRTWNEWNVPSGARYCSYGGGIVESATIQMKAVIDAMRDVLAKYADDEFDWIVKTDFAFERLVRDIKEKDSCFVSAVRHKVAYMSRLIEKLFGYDPVSTFVSEVGDGEWTDVLIERLQNEPSYIKQYVLCDNDFVNAGTALWMDVAKKPSDYVLGKFRIKYFKQNGGIYFELINGDGELHHFLINFILFHTGCSLVFDDLSYQRANTNSIDIVVAFRKSNAAERKDPYEENAYKDGFLAQHVLHNSCSDDITFLSEVKLIHSDIYEFDDIIARLKGSKEICYALEWICLLDVTSPGPYVHLATAYLNANWSPIANMLIHRAYLNSFVTGGIKKCVAYEDYFPQFFERVRRPSYLNNRDFVSRLSASLRDTCKTPNRMLRISDSAWEYGVRQSVDGFEND